MIWDQDVWFLPEPDLASMLLAGVVLLALLERGRGAGSRVNRSPGGAVKRDTLPKAIRITRPLDVPSGSAS